jgi:hypothetical protein
MRTLGNAIDTSVWNVGFGQAGKNKIINGDFRVWQRGTSFAATSGQFFADRYYFSTDANPTSQTVTQQTFTPGTAPVAGYEGQFFLRSTITTAGSSSVSEFVQKIEDVRTFAGQTATLSFWAKGDSARSSIINVSQNFGSGGSGGVGISSASFSYTTSWQRFSFILTVPSIAGKTIGTNSSLNIAIRQAVANGSVFDIWGVQVEYGSRATPFQTASGGSIQGELAMCQRYYYRQTPSTSFGWVAFGLATGTSGGAVGTTFPVQMRATPTLIEWASLSASDAASSTALTALTLDTNVSSSTVGVTNFAVASGLTAFRPYYLRQSSTTAGHLAFSAEL